MAINSFLDGIYKIDKRLIEMLLTDHSTNRHILWATSDYTRYGEYCAPECEITVEQIIGLNSKVIRPRVMKAREKQSNRTRDKGEVFTPSWICNAQNNLVDEHWFGRADVFNSTSDKKWCSTKGKILFPDTIGRTWKDYVKAKRMEITCGEAPYLVSRYDTVTGDPINDVYDRIGLLDRKLRVIDENTENEAEWFGWVKKAYQSTYGYEYQGDNLFLARENLLLTFVDHMMFKFHRQPTFIEIRQIAYIISWNIWQMDGLSYMAPYSEELREAKAYQLTLFTSDDEQETVAEGKAVPCVIRDWTGKRKVEYRALVQKRMSKR